jgi:hypothetical protein
VKLKHPNKAAGISRFGQKHWIRLLLGKRKTRTPRITRRRHRKAKALAAANRRAYVSFAVSAVVTVGLIAMVLSVPPRISPEQLAADVKAMRVRKMADFSAEATDPAAHATPSNRTSLHEIAESVSASSSASTRNGTPHYPPVSFEKLSAFRFFVTDKALDSLTSSRNCLGQIPEDVRALNETDVSVSGFMLPMKYEGKLTTEFLLLKNQSLCCYGKPPRITEWVNVRMAGKGVKPIMDEPITVCGIFHVGEVRENGELVGVYRLDADKVRGPRH